MDRTVTLLMTCRDQKGLIYRISEFIFRHNGNILHADRHIDSETGQFFYRVEWDPGSLDLSDKELKQAFQPLANDVGMEWELRFSDERPRVAIFVSKLDHCLMDLMYRKGSGELPAEFVAIVSNHEWLQSVATTHGIPYHVFPVTPGNKRAQEQKELELLESLHVDLIILARYMQVLSKEFVSYYPNRIINIHPSFLPAFAGANPYGQACHHGVKLVGATSHYVTATVDEGPIIEQDVSRVNHHDTMAEFVRKGRDLERVVLAKAVRLHLERCVLPYGNKTIVFN